MEAGLRRNPLGLHASVLVAHWSNAEANRALRITKDAGFDFIEIPLLDLEHLDVAWTRQHLADLGLSVTCSLGLSFDKDISSPDRDAVQRGEAFLMEALDVAAALGSSYLGGVLYSAMGKYLRPPWAGAAPQVADVLQRVAAAAADRGITVGLEPVNRYESNLVNTASQALKLIDLTDASNIVVHLDSYHMNIEEGDFEKPVHECGERLGYVHVGESHRGYLGTGTIDFAHLFRALARSGYAGPIAFESFSSAVVSQEFASALAVWRDLWDSGEDLALAAHDFIRQQLATAIRALNMNITTSEHPVLPTAENNSTKAPKFINRYKGGPQ